MARKQLFAVIVLATAGLFAQERHVTITPAQQVLIDQFKQTAAKWAADPAVVAAVETQNKRGRLAGMDEKKWALLTNLNREVDALRQCAAALRLRQLAAETGGVVVEAFVCAAKGEKAAFVDKPSAYVHAGNVKFDVPFRSLADWQGELTFDESAKSMTVQVSTPVVRESKDAEGKPRREAIGVLVIGLNMRELVKASKPPK